MVPLWDMPLYMTLVHTRCQYMAVSVVLVAIHQHDID
jgi:hypothetical protein